MVGFRLTGGAAGGRSGPLPHHGFLLLALHDQRRLAVFEVYYAQPVYRQGCCDANRHNRFFPGNADVRLPATFVAPPRRKEERRKLN